MSKKMFSHFQFLTQASNGCGRMWWVVYEYMGVISVGVIDPLDSPTRPSKRPAAGCGASLCLPFIMRCHLVPLAVSGLLVSPCDTHHEYDNTFLAFSLLIGQRQTPPQYIFSYTAASHWPPCFPKPSSSLGSCSILMRQARLCFLHLLVVLWSCGAGGEGCRPGSGIRSRRRRRLQPCQFAVSWTACEKKQKKNSHGHVAERWWWGLRLRLWAG